MKNFTVEEINLMCCFNTSSRKRLIDDMKSVMIAFIGPSGCGKSTFLRLLNRMNDLIPDTRLTGEIRIDGRCV